MNHSHSHLERRRRPAIAPPVTATIQRPAVVGHDTVAHATGTRAIEVGAMTQAEEELS